jgi:hypothetical protein
VALGQLRSIDAVARRAVIALEEGREVAVTFPAHANIEVREPATLGTMGGRLEDLRVGYWVEVSLHEAEGHACACTSLVCLS